MARPHYSNDDDMAEREPLDNQNYRGPHAPGHAQQYQDQYQQAVEQQQSQQQQQQYYQQPSRGARPGRLPGMHPDSSFSQLRNNRRYSRDSSASLGDNQPPPYLTTNAPAANNYRQPDPVSPISPPQPPPHRSADGRQWGREPGYPPRSQQPRPQSNITPGADNFSEAAAGGMAGIAYTVAERNARESGLEAMRAPTNPQQAYHQGQGYSEQYGGGLRAGDNNHNRYSYGEANGGGVSGSGSGGSALDRSSHPSLAGLTPGAIPPGLSTPGARTPSRSSRSFTNDVYTDDPYQSYSRPQDPHLGVVNPNEIEDDGDEGLEYGRRGPRTSMLSLGGSSHRGRDGAAAAGVVGGAAAAGGVMGALGGLVGRNNGGRGGHHGHYGPVHNASTSYQGGGGNGGVNASTYDLGSTSMSAEKSDWLAKERRRSKKWKIAIGLGVGLAVVAGIVCGVVFGVVLKKGGSGNNSSSTAAGDTAANGDLGINSPEIKALLNNPNLHKVFPGVDYTPINTQYPDCIHNPPSQNNITRDIAVLSQLTNTIRLYGTDCNQTEMALHALQRLEMQDTVKLWMGVWQDDNTTTNERQLDQMWTILDTYGPKPFKGVIVANEILFRNQMSVWELGQLLTTVRANLTTKGMSLPVATSDLGDKWTAQLAQQSDYVMANIHPFFGGINANDAADWTYSFWEGHNGAFFKSDKSRNIISETGWPSQGGTNCGVDGVTDCPKASVAGVQQLNRFMDDWVCTALSNGTEYFWFEAFDEPWKIKFDEEGKNWEDHWGLMDVNRQLKKGVKIPDCGGKTVR